MIKPPERWQKRARPGRDDESWLITYSDMATLLLAFFVMMLSISNLDLVKYREIKNKILGYFAPTLGESTRNQAARELGKLAQQAPYRGEVRFQVKGDLLMLDFQAAALFQPGSARLSPSAQKLLREVVDAASSLVVNGYRIEVSGHSDGTPEDLGRHGSAWEVSAARAARVVEELVKLGVPKTLLKATAYGDTFPPPRPRAAPGKGQAGPPNNRRVVMEIRRPF